MGRFGDIARSLRPGNDRQLAAEQYADRESATDRAARVEAERERAATRKKVERHRNGGADRAARKGDRWDKADRRRFS